MTDRTEDRERIAAQVEDLLAGWHDDVERVAGDGDEPDTIVARDGDRVAAILPLDEDTVDAMLDAAAEGELAQWLRDELAEDADGDEDGDSAEPGGEQDDDLEAAADRWLGEDDEEDAADADADDEGDASDDEDDDFDLEDWDDPEADALIDELPS